MLRRGERFGTLKPLQLRANVEVPSQDAFARVTLQTSERFQTFIGFGGSFTESSAGLPLSDEQQTQVVEAYYSKEKGLGYHDYDSRCFNLNSGNNFF